MDMHTDDSLFKNLDIFAKGMERVTMALFGGVAAGLPNDTLSLSGSGPFSFDGSFRRYAWTWLADASLRIDTNRTPR
jgi:primary-amine oxidase